MTLVARNIAISSTTIHVDFPASSYFVNEPAVLVTIWGAPTQVDVALNTAVISGVGAVITSMDLTFQAGAVGKRASILVTSV